jgi:hypothetical protein
VGLADHEELRILCGIHQECRAISGQSTILDGDRIAMGPKGAVEIRRVTSCGLLASQHVCEADACENGEGNEPIHCLSDGMGGFLQGRAASRADMTAPSYGSFEPIVLA